MAPTQSQTINPAVDEWRKNWTLVAASMAGLSFAAVASATLGLFISPLSEEFGWSRAEITIGLSIYAVTGVLLAPFAGALIDRWGARRMGVPGIALAAIALSAISLANGTIAQWVVLWSLYSLAAVAIKTTVWTAAVSSVFTSGRGLALAVTLSGAAVTQSLAPVTAQWLIHEYGWRVAYMCIGAGWGAFVLLLLLPFFFDARDRNNKKAAVSPAITTSPTQLPGLATSEAIRNVPLIKIGLAALCTLIPLAAMTIHAVPIITERGFTRETAAIVISSAGIAALCGKLFTGWLLDRWASGWISGISLALPIFSCVLLIDMRPSMVQIAVAVALLGYTNGAALQVITYLTSRYAGMLNFGKIFGVMSSLITMGVGIGPVLAGLIYDHFGSYSLLLMGSVPLLLLGGLLVSRLGVYPDWSESGSHTD